jgi:hypothetical protein
MTTSQNKRILAHLKTGQTITGKWAMLEMGVMHLPRRILDLKEAGHNITDVWEVNRNGKRYKRWSIINNGERR